MHMKSSLVRGNWTGGEGEVVIREAHRQGGKENHASKIITISWLLSWPHLMSCSRAVKVFRITHLSTEITRKENYSRATNLGAVPTWCSL